MERPPKGQPGAARHKIKYCPQALTMIATLKRTSRGTRKDWASTGQGTAIHNHLERCLKCGRDLEGVPWPPP